jgi:hypothetical protein
MRSLLPRRIVPGVAIVLAFAAVGLLLGGLLGGGKTRPSGIAGIPAPRAQARFDRGAVLASHPKDESVIVRARHRSIAVYRSRHGDRRRLQAQHGLVVDGHPIPLVFLQISRRGHWLLVRLPGRPNRSTGWLRRRDVTVATTTLRILVQLRRHRLELRDRGRVVLHRPIAVGHSLSPTPTGRYFVVDTIAPPDPHGFYGPYALGLSAYSTVYTTFAGGNGQVGIHGTNQPSKIGTDVSHGCIRLDNATITRLAKRLPLGTPVDIRRS